ncbi:MAG: ATP-binding cassette domain-containing protein [Hyphomicrobiales bacterium]|nr:ATP-binding cassette domain-containing protein [Hyphomicrobiales bacterium]
MLTVENLAVFYGDAQALDAVSLEVEEGAIVAIVGANGAGKTSLIRTIAGMHRPRRGRIRFGAFRSRSIVARACRRNASTSRSASGST